MDMTEWLIHFTRPREGRSARENLVSIAREGVLRPSWSERSGRRTIYGPRPCVCFTEQPLWAFVEYVRIRGGNSLSGYGVCVHKRDVFADGGRPVIYGGDWLFELPETVPEYAPGQRTLEGIAPDEQYRYVAFNPNADKGPIDWSHEREWRWPTGANEPPPASVLPNAVGTFRLAGSHVAGSGGMSSGRTHLLVERDADIPWLQKELAPTAAIGSPTDWRHDVRWRTKLAATVGIFSLETVDRMLKAQTPLSGLYARLETWPRANPVAVAGGIAVGVPFRSANELLG